jgi:hypothetical protein
MKGDDIAERLLESGVAVLKITSKLSVNPCPKQEGFYRRGRRGALRY